MEFLILLGLIIAVIRGYPLGRASPPRHGRICDPRRPRGPRRREPRQGRRRRSWGWI